ncbi:MAG TPA: type I restriction-modification enzyme R subunit C-terminal domain-containing protein, partial [Allocoleopsis sp.]
KGRKINQQHQEQIEMLSGMSYTDMINYIQNNPPANVAEWLKNKAQIAEILDRKDNLNTSKYLISYHEDELRGVEFNYGTTNNPEEYLQQFKIFLQDNINEIPVLKKIIESPKDLTRQELKDLLFRLDQDGYKELNLQVAWREITKEDIKATIIGFIRKSLLDESLISYDERIDQAMNKILSEKNWNDAQKTWLNRISNQFKIEIILGRENFEEGQFKQQGGFKRINNILNGELESILGEIKENIW